MGAAVEQVVDAVMEQGVGVAVPMSVIIRSSAERMLERVDCIVRTVNAVLWGWHVAGDA